MYLSLISTFKLSAPAAKRRRVEVVVTPSPAEAPKQLSQKIAPDQQLMTSNEPSPAGPADVSLTIAQLTAILNNLSSVLVSTPALATALMEVDISSMESLVNLFVMDKTALVRVDEMLEAAGAPALQRKVSLKKHQPVASTSKASEQDVAIRRWSDGVQDDGTSCSDDNKMRQDEHDAPPSEPNEKVAASGGANKVSFKNVASYPSPGETFPTVDAFVEACRAASKVERGKSMWKSPSSNSRMMMVCTERYGTGCPFSLVAEREGGKWVVTSGIEKTEHDHDGEKDDDSEASSELSSSNSDSEVSDNKQDGRLHDIRGGTGRSSLPTLEALVSNRDAIVQAQKSRASAGSQSASRTAATELVDSYRGTTNNPHGSRIIRYLNFCDSKGIPALPVYPDVVMLWICEMAKNGLAVTSCRTSVSSINKLSEKTFGLWRTVKGCQELECGSLASCESVAKMLKALAEVEEEDHAAKRQAIQRTGKKQSDGASPQHPNTPAPTHVDPPLTVAQLTALLRGLNPILASTPLLATALIKIGGTTTNAFVNLFAMGKDGRGKVDGLLEEAGAPALHRKMLVKKVQEMADEFRL
ncbi:hypothetical protein MNV49_002370 [Pseudohyphozyma bogoriensis]|nr:hypothetical protein MNV49_002370 [Pseudohyphozyma bogoriensis]